MMPNKTKKKRPLPLACIKRPTPTSLKRISKREWRRKINTWVGSLKDDPTAERDLQLVLNITRGRHYRIRL